MHLIDGIDIENLIKAANRFEDFRKNLNTDQEKAGAIQAFEYSYELAWKTIKRLLEKRVNNLYSLKEIFREAAVAGLINEPKLWFHFIEIRNLTVHTYNEKNVELIIAIFDDFSKALSELLLNLEKFK